MSSRTGNALGLSLGLLSISRLVSAQGVCDIYTAGGTPCIAAHSTTRSLFTNFSDNLYQVSRSSDGATMDIGVVTTGGIADSAAQDSFCANTSCYITIIYDQTDVGNDLKQAPPGGNAVGPAAGGYDNLADATAAPVYLAGQKVYGVSISPGMGYRNNAAQKTATGDAAESIYAVLDGTDYNNECCFDYGNAETNSDDNGSGHMEAIYFGSFSDPGSGSGSGPWIMVDMENGLYADNTGGQNTNDPTISSRFVTAAVKGESNQWAIRGGDSTTGSLTTYFSGVRPNGYNPMNKEGAIILGTGGDNSDSAQGTFYEGAMTAGYPSDDTENSVQANIVAAAYSA